MSVLMRNNVMVSGSCDAPAMVFAHGFGCDQHMWRFVTPAFEDTHRIVVFDHVGAGGSDLNAYSRERYGTLQGYADDVLQIYRELELTNTIFVGHSVSAMIGILAAMSDPDRFAKLILVGPSPRYIDDDEYMGGFTHHDIEALLDSLDSNYFGWSQAIAPVIMGNGDRPELASELSNSFCRTDPEIAKHFAAVTFLSDNRDDLHRLKTPTLVLQCAEDTLAPRSVGEYVHGQIPDSELIFMNATGHCPNLSAPAETIAAIKAFL
jgi:sigma-B regulation protein RsbQ